MKELIAEKNGVAFDSVVERLKSKAGPEERNERRYSRSLSPEGVTVILFWLLVMALNVVGWWFLFHRVIPIIGRWVGH